MFFELALAFVDSKRRSPPQLSWLKTIANKAKHSLSLPAGARSVLAEMKKIEQELGGRLSSQMKMHKGKIESTARFQRQHDQPR